MNIKNWTKYFLSTLVFVSLFGLSFAGEVEESIGNAICGIVNVVTLVLGAVMLILVVLAAIIYAAGQVLGAETRARANVWATTMFVGAIIGGLIYLVVPLFLSTLVFGDANKLQECCAGDTFNSSCGT